MKSSRIQQKISDETDGWESGFPMPKKIRRVHRLYLFLGITFLIIFGVTIALYFIPVKITYVTPVDTIETCHLEIFPYWFKNKWIRQGIETMSTLDGELQYIAEFKNNKQLWYKLYKNGVILEEYTRGGIMRAWYSNGQLDEETFYNSNGEKHGISRGWAKDGRLRSECYYNNGKITGLYTTYDHNGEIFFQEVYDNGHFVKTIIDRAPEVLVPPPVPTPKTQGKSSSDPIRKMDLDKSDENEKAKNGNSEPELNSVVPDVEYCPHAVSGKSD